MRKIFVLVTCAIVLAGLVLLGLDHAAASVADTNVSYDEVASSLGEACHSSVGAAITIMMYAEPDE